MTDAQSNVTAYTYDTENNLTRISDAKGHHTDFAYDALGRVSSTAFPSSFTENYVYDLVGNLTRKTDRKGQQIQYAYDSLDRLTQKIYPDSTAVSYTYDLDNRLTQASDPTGTYQFAYDHMGRLAQTTTSYTFYTGRTFVNSYSYDAASNRTGFTDPEQGHTTYSYDLLNRLSGFTDIMGRQFGFSYDVLSRRTHLSRPNGVTTDYTYDTLSRLLSVVHKRNGTTTFDGANYTLDAVGNRTAKTNLLNTQMSGYSYDEIYQLTNALLNGQTSETYSYDSVGNRLSSLGVSPYSYDDSNELTSKPGTTYVYDHNGNVTSKTDSSGTTTYTWDFENRLTQVSVPGSGSVTYRYDPFGRRIYRSGSPNYTYAYDGANTIAEYDTGAKKLIAVYAFGPGIDEPLANYRFSNVGSLAMGPGIMPTGIYYFEADGLGSITSLTADGSGALSASFVYDSYGNVTASSGSTTLSRYRYTGREWEPTTGLYYYRARYYDPSIGRFISEDPDAISVPFSMYAYVGNGPTLFNDPSGLKRHNTKPPQPLLGGMSDAEQDDVATGYQAALARIGNKKCRDLFGCKGEDRLKATTYHTYTLGPRGAYTENPTNVWLNSNGAFFAATDGNVRLPNTGTVYHLGGLADVQAFMLLHELGHQLSDITHFKPDKDLPELNESQSLEILMNCFPDRTRRAK